MHYFSLVLTQKILSALSASYNKNGLVFKQVLFEKDKDISPKVFEKLDINIIFYNNSAILSFTRNTYYSVMIVVFDPVFTVKLFT